MLTLYSLHTRINNCVHFVLAVLNGCGRHGLGLWPSWCVAVMVMVCGRHGQFCGRHGLWPSWSKPLNSESLDRLGVRLNVYLACYSVICLFVKVKFNDDRRKQ